MTEPKTANSLLDFILIIKLKTLTTTWQEIGKNQVSVKGNKQTKKKKHAKILPPQPCDLLSYLNLKKIYKYMIILGNTDLLEHF